ncbi:MAG: hypothetical protein IJO22_08640 [Oscillospiraceae bacterium]|nr:hypothetical protein [Oscillospiraceae bacterium]
MKIKKIAFIVLSFFLLFFSVMQISTFEIYKEIRSTVFDTTDYVDENIFSQEEIKNSNMVLCDMENYPGNIKRNFNYTATAINISGTTDVVTSLKMFPYVALHNFSKGVVWFKYSVQVKNVDGEMITGVWGVPVKMYIEKINGHWIVTDIYEELYPGRFS